jgi:hypothetical protein
VGGLFKDVSRIQTVERHNAAGCSLVRGSVLMVSSFEPPESQKSASLLSPTFWAHPTVCYLCASRFSSHYNVRISVHPNELIASLTEPPIQRRLR